MVTILRRRRLGRTSCRELAKHIGLARVNRSDRNHNYEHVSNVIRWGCTASIPRCEEGDRRIRVINNARAIHQVNDKLSFRDTLSQHDLCPRTWFDYQEFIDEGYEYPVIVRPSRHAQGRNLDVCGNESELIWACQKYISTGYYISEFIEKIREYRVFVVQGRVACVANKIPGNPDDVAWNVAKGGKFENVRWNDWPLKACDIAIKAFNLTDLDFGGVDVMEDAGGNVYVLEINSAPSLTSPYRQEKMGKALNYLIYQNRHKIPLSEEKGGMLKFGHPSLSEKVWL